MSDVLKCGECRFWVKERRNDNKVVGQCKVDGPQMGPNGYGYWPLTDTDEYCFRHELPKKDLLTESEINKMVDSGKIPPKPEPPPKRIIKEDIL